MFLIPVYLESMLRATRKIKNFMFNIHEAIWWVVAEIEDWLYPYHDRLTPADKFEIRVKDPISGTEYMVEEHIQGINEKLNRLQDENWKWLNDLTSKEIQVIIEQAIKYDNAERV